MKYALAVLIMLSACDIDDCSIKLKFKLNYYAFEGISVNGNSYCDLVNKSLSGDSTSIVNLSKLAFYDGASYEHGAVLIEVIDKISESRYCQIISSLTINELTVLYSTINAGLDYTVNKKFYRKKIKEIFPILYSFLNNRINPLST